MQPKLKLVGTPPDQAPHAPRSIPGRSALHRAGPRTHQISAPDSDRSLRSAPVKTDGGAVAKANRDAAGLSHDDSRWIFAASVAAHLEHGAAAILAPEKRERLLSRASLLGLRPFDANMVIAIVQDEARRGALLNSSSNALNAAAIERLKLVPEPGRSSPPTSHAHSGAAWSQLLGAMVLGGIIAWAIFRALSA